MRYTMHKLLSRKSNIQRTSNHDKPNQPNPSKPVPHSPPDDSTERVFPIQNQRNEVDTPWLARSARMEEPKYNDAHVDSSPTAFRSDDSPPPSSPEDDSNCGERPNNRKVSERSKFLFLKSGPVGLLPSDAARGDGNPYRRCEDEPIHTPGAIQSYGALLGLKYSAHGQLEIRIASENTRKILGYGPEHLFTMTSFLDILRPDGRAEMTARINHTLQNIDALKDETRLDVFQIHLTFPYEPEIRLWCAIHLAPSPSNLVICEFEEYLDAFYLNDMRMAKSLPESPVRHMDHEVTPEEFEKSTTIASKPLPVIEIARTRKNKEFSSLDVFNAMSQSQQQITACSTVQELMDVTVGLIVQLTGFHRVMFYRFDEQMNGCVDAELLNPRACVDVFRGMHFPAADIPKQARELYIVNRIRILHDRRAQTARLVCRDETDIRTPLDLTHSYLRAMSPVHNKYLANMSVRSTLSISTVIDSKLWGLIACHGYGDAGIRVSLPIRELCRNIGECAASNIRSLTMKQRLEIRRPPPVNPVSQTPASYLAASASDLLNLVDADFALLSIEEESRAIGRLDPYQEALAIMTYLQTCRFTEIRSSININTDFPGIAYAPGINSIAGLLIVPFNIGGLNDFMVFFRRGQTKEVKWAGNPYDKTFKTGSEYLDPRGSFQRWTETIAGTCREWTGDQIDTASILSLLYGRFVEIWRQKGSSVPNDKMALIRSSSSQLRNPLNTITGYLEMALENKVDSKTRHFLSRAQEASNSMAVAVDNLAKIANGDEGSAQPAEETFNLNLTVSRLTKALQKEAQRKNLDLTITVHDHLPSMVKSDGDKLKHLLAHLTSNAFKKASSVKVDIDLISTKDDISVIGLRVQDAGPGMNETELDNTFQQLEQAHSDEDWLFAAEPNSKRPNSDTDPDLLAIAKYVRAVNGQIRLSSEVGRGTLFSIELPFKHVQTTESSNMPRRLRNLFSPSGSGSTKAPTNGTSRAPHPVPLKISAPMNAYKVVPPNEAQKRVETLPPLPVELRTPSRVERQPIRDEKAFNQRSVTYESSALPEVRSSSRLSMQISEKSQSSQTSNPRAAAYESLTHGEYHSSLRTPTNSNSNSNSQTQTHSEKSLSPRSAPYDSTPNPSANGYGPRKDSLHSRSPTALMPEPEMQAAKVQLSLNMLIAEDNFVTQRMLDKQLTQLGHTVTIAGDGQECHDLFVASGMRVDIVLMDLKMPLVDGELSTKMIRYWEKESKRMARERQRDSSPKPRVPIIAVSADLGEDGRFECIQSGFDGWLQKPIDFPTLNTLLTGLKDRNMKRDCLFVPGGKGGWFFP